MRCMRWLVPIVVVGALTAVTWSVQAQASTGAARKAGRAAVRMFERVTPDRARSHKTSCRSRTTWRYWHCTVKVSGWDGYKGTFDAKVKRSTGWTKVTAWIVIPPPDPAP